MYFTPSRSSGRVQKLTTVWLQCFDALSLFNHINKKQRWVSSAAIIVGASLWWVSISLYGEACWDKAVYYVSKVYEDIGAFNINTVTELLHQYFDIILKMLLFADLLYYRYFHLDWMFRLLSDRSTSGDIILLSNSGLSQLLLVSFLPCAAKCEKVNCTMFYVYFYAIFKWFD